ncbi:putative matrix protein [Cytorhabdovirus tiliae]|uniref:Matrix protein n=1 Tax=Cytorhabdovirus sp. 'tiliae' TaxID=3004219 RepID=A0A9J7CAG2_9RHAB|nr:putative matrix protein [Cytorhabdovirus tiliae]
MFMESSSIMNKFKFISVFIDFAATVYCKRGVHEELFPDELLSGLADKLAVKHNPTVAGRLLKIVLWIIKQDPSILMINIMNRPNIYIEGESSAWDYRVKALRVVRVISELDCPETNLLGKVTYMHEDENQDGNPVTSVRDFQFNDTRSKIVSEDIVLKGVCENPDILIPITYSDVENLYEPPVSVPKSKQAKEGPKAGSSGVIKT